MAQSASAAETKAVEATFRVISNGTSLKISVPDQAGITVPCAIGKNGLSAHKMEGDGKTPLGDFAILRGYYRPDRVTLPGEIQMQMTPLTETDGWCDDPAHTMYNHHVELPFAGSHEKLWREDELYDVLFVLDYNLYPTLPYKGSAIFFHIASDSYGPTAGCVAIAKKDMLRILPLVGRTSRMVIQSGGG